jgi:hypothetical protein
MDGSCLINDSILGQSLIGRTFRTKSAYTYQYYNHDNVGFFEREDRKGLPLYTYELNDCIDRNFVLKVIAPFEFTVVDIIQSFEIPSIFIVVEVRPIHIDNILMRCRNNTWMPIKNIHHAVVQKVRNAVTMRSGSAFACYPRQDRTGFTIEQILSGFNIHTPIMYDSDSLKLLK